MGNRLFHVLLVCLAVVSLVLYGLRRRGPTGQLLDFDATGCVSAAGQVRCGGDRDCYLIRAEAGQFWTITVTSSGQDAVFHVHLPGADKACLPGAAHWDRAVSWQGTLPRTGLYRIVIEARRESTSYALRIAKGGREGGGCCNPDPLGRATFSSPERL